ncbi:transposase [Clostridium tertium]|uniref:Transposase n=1 Tax=Clostridium tertium TaxID=1559 RepID=A0A9X3XRA8_9CLOT|nr:IS630 transposase-related protein [Clostridium tertium]MDC4241812.1 transposase [Clostridium tertium]
MEVNIEMVLGEKHYKCINLLIEGNKITEISKMLPASRQAIYNWLGDKEFKAELDKQRQEIKKRGQDKILAKFDTYIDKIHNIAMNSSSDNVKLNALEFLVEHIIGKPTSKIEQSITDNKNNNDIDIDDIIAEVINDEDKDNIA